MKQPAHTERGGIKPWRCVAPLLGTLAAATIVTVSLPSAQTYVPPKDVTAVSIQAKAQETKEERHEKARLLKTLVGVAVGVASAVGLYHLVKRIPED